MSGKQKNPLYLNSKVLSVKRKDACGCFITLDLEWALRGSFVQTRSVVCFHFALSSDVFKYKYIKLNMFLLTFRLRHALGIVIFFSSLFVAFYLCKNWSRPVWCVCPKALQAWTGSLSLLSNHTHSRFIFISHPGKLLKTHICARRD